MIFIVRRLHQKFHEGFLGVISSQHCQFPLEVKAYLSHDSWPPFHPRRNKCMSAAYNSSSFLRALSAIEATLSPQQ